jgi:hypothetical protein
MSSPTLLKILENWKGDPTKEESPISCPFDVENFCREQDEKIALLEQRLELATEALRTYRKMPSPMHMLAARTLDSIL